VLIVFMILQRFGAKPYQDEESWDPSELPEISTEQNIKPGELIVGLVFGILFLMLVTLFPQWIGFITSPGGKFYPNPVILDNLLIIQVSLGINMLFNIYLLWRGRWEFLSRIVKIGLEVFSIYVLAILVQGHNAWLAARSSAGLLDGLDVISTITDGGWELVGMHAFRFGFAVALIVTSIEVLGLIYRLVRSKLQNRILAKDLAAKIE
jgi:hypothetical protein